jgi:hypothetical protein
MKNKEKDLIKLYTMNSKKYLLYIDILGFTDLVKENDNKITTLFEIIDNLNVHRHSAFSTIAFSDTILVYNNDDPLNTYEHEYFVMFACEFVQDLQVKIRNMNIHFRAILTYGEFFVRQMKNVQSYHGQAFLYAYEKEKQINGIGLFIDKRISKYNTFLRSTSFDDDFDFVFLLQTLERLHTLGEFKIPLDRQLIEITKNFLFLDTDVQYLSQLKSNIDNLSNSKIRGKYIQTYYYYKSRYPWLCSLFEANDFDHKVLNREADWSYIAYE